MCVAAIIFNPVPLNYLEAMEESNPHGAGVAWLQDESIRFIRGISAKDIHQMQEDKVMTYPYLMHYRWATHGARVSELTHPFPLGPRALLGELSGSCNALLIHNGTWNRYEKAAAQHMNFGNYEIPEEILTSASDTAIAAWLALDNQDILDEVQWATAVAEIKEIDGKKTMEITTRGTWSDKEGNWYSNLNWVPWEGYNFPSDYYSNNSSRAAYWDDWEKRYRSNEDTNQTVDSSDIDWDLYFLAPFSTREEKDRHLNFDQYVERFRKKPLAHASGLTEETRAPSSGEMSWDDYLIAKYGVTVANQIKRDCFPDEGCDGAYPGCDWDPNDPKPLALVCGYAPTDGEPVLEFDPDTVSEDFETVNAILERQMRGKWAHGE